MKLAFLLRPDFSKQPKESCKNGSARVKNATLFPLWKDCQSYKLNSQELKVHWFQLSYLSYLTFNFKVIPKGIPKKLIRHFLNFYLWKCICKKIRMLYQRISFHFAMKFAKRKQVMVNVFCTIEMNSCIILCTHHMDDPFDWITIFWSFTLQGPSLGMPKGLLIFGGPKNSQSNDFFRYTKIGSDLKFFGQIWKIQSGSPVWNRKKKFFRVFFIY